MTICIEAYGVLVYCTAIGSSVCCITRYRSNCRSPTIVCKRILCSSSLGRSCAIVRRSSTKRHILIGLKNCTVLILPNNGVLVHCLRECSGIGLCFRYDIDTRIPTAEGVRILSSSRLGRCSTSVNRCSTVTQIIALNFYTLNHELNCINITIVFDFYDCATVSCNRCLAEC